MTDPRDPEQPSPDRLDPASGDAFVVCAQGHRHWGRFGAAGLMLVRQDPGRAEQVLLQHRALWSDQGGTWAVPGGALHRDEDAVTGALREAAEEAAVDPGALTVVGDHVLDHGTWRYTTVVAVASGPQPVRATDHESLAVEWTDLADVEGLPLLSAFRVAWPTLMDILRSRVV